MARLANRPVISRYVFALACAWAVISFLFVIFQYWIIYYRYMPFLENILHDSASEGVSDIVSGLLAKIILHLSVWVFLHFVLLILFIPLIRKRGLEAEAQT
jgi:hypothetical protein